MSDFHKWFMDYYKSFSFWEKVEYRWIHFWDNLWMDFQILLWKLKGKPVPNLDYEYPCNYENPDTRDDEKI